MLNGQSERITALQAQTAPLQPDDLMSEAGRKVMLRDFINMLRHEEGSRSGDDIEDVHDMRVATRRLRSALRLLAPHYKSKVADGYRRSLRKVARALGGVRDLDVMIDNLSTYQAGLDDRDKLAFQPVINALAKEREAARHELIAALNKRDYSKFVNDFGLFLSTPGAAARQPDGTTPARVRHVLPMEIYEHLGAVRAYDSVLPTSDDTTLHALRIEFKRLRYLLTFFSDVLGNPSQEFISNLKVIQDHLGRLNDIHVAHNALAPYLDDLDDDQAAVLKTYLDGLEEEAPQLRAGFGEIWRRFNGKSMQKLLANAVSAL